uniref:Osteoclast-stimulating factor 1 n=1 Tax=Nothobranchius furzeri TaxID=105023 RepID=A0A8C6KD18_NOTFU
MEMWRQCAMWLIDCRVLPENHRVTWEGAQVCDLAQALRDGVLLCQLLNNLLPQAVNLREINLRPQMSQFLCLKNIRTFLGVCQERFHLKKNELFEAFELFDVRDFGKVRPHFLSFDKRECCLQEIRQTEEKYTDTLESILKELASTHRSLLDEVRNSILMEGAKTLHQVFVNYKERLLLYGHYCSQVEAATKHLDKLSSMREDVRMKLEECSNRANSGRFSLRDLLMVPMQRVLKYHLLLQVFALCHSFASCLSHICAFMCCQDLAQCVNEVKRDNEIIKQITSFQMSIENLTQSLAVFGRPKIDGELKVCSMEKKSKQDRYAFLFDKAVIICKKKSGETFDLKEIIELNHYQIRDETTGEKDNKKWSYLFLLLDCYGKCGYDFFFKTRELKKKWLEQFEMALSNMCPENANANNHDFQMFCFEETTSCKACSMLLRGTFFQGYQCTRCKMAAHKECLGRVPACGRISDISSLLFSLSGFPKMEVCQEYYGLPPPPVGFGQPLQLLRGDIIELTRADIDLTWWEVRTLLTPLYLFYLFSVSSCSWPIIHIFLSDFKSKRALFSPFVKLKSCLNSFFTSVNIPSASHRFNMDIKHIKITCIEGLYRINDKKAFKSLIEMIEFYQQNSLKEYFRDVDTTLHTPYKQPEQSNSSNNTPNTTPGGSIKSFGVARARYDYSARDRTELSLREGDTIKILSKKGHSGWWRGEVYGRVGLFPSNYVDEDFSDYWLQ